MSERYSTCRQCGGRGIVPDEKDKLAFRECWCSKYGEPGFDGNADYLRQKEAQREHEEMLREGWLDDRFTIP